MSIQQVKPLGNRILIKRATATFSKGGILLPDTAQEKPKQGEVIAVGPGEMDENGNLTPMGLKVGDAVIFSSFAGTEVKAEDETDTEYLIMSENDVLAVLS